MKNGRLVLWLLLGVTGLWMFVERTLGQETTAVRAVDVHSEDDYGVDPQFNDAEKGDLSLQPGSAVRNAGVRAK